MIRVLLPTHLGNLANGHREIMIQVEGPATISSVLDVLETQYPVLRGTIRDQTSKLRRPFIRFFGCGQDLSLDPADGPLPEAIATGAEPLNVVGAMAGG